ncbi:MAG: PDZ domain-containing protein [Capsulimonadaceae bacterium]|nr:PDZ domain-containing protein [Capsulimonadaceae bacterium]
MALHRSDLAHSMPTFVSLAAVFISLSASVCVADPLVGAPVTTPSQKSLLLDMQDAFTKIAATAEPFVVNIKAERAVENQRAGHDNPLPAIPPDPDKSPAPDTGNGDASPFPKSAQSTGSGAIVSPDGYIITNDHVVEGTKLVTVTLNDGREFTGKVWSDHASDLAVVKIDPGAAKLPFCTFADSDAVTPGQWAIAIGSPFDLQNTMTLGIISATRRHQTIPDGPASGRYYPDLIQTDAAINPGNSGGPLINIDGQVVGINVAIESPVEGNAGIGFAIPAKVAQRVMAALIKYGKVTRGFLGLAPADLTPAKQQEFGLVSGAWVMQVDKDSPAGRAGIHAGDAIVSFAGKPITDELTLRPAIADAAPGTTVPVQLVRGGQTISVNVTVGSPPPSQEVAKAEITPQPASKRIGVGVRTITAADRSQLSLDTTQTGALVVAVLSNSPAEHSGLRTGDIITRISKTTIATADDAAKALSALGPGAQATVIIIRSDHDKIFEIALNLRFSE